MQVVASIFDWDLGGWLTLGFRLIFALVGGVIGWFATPPVFRVLFRLAFHRPAPGTTVFAARLVGALVIGTILFLYAPGAGGGGWGFGGGGGGGWFGSGPGKGKGEGEGKAKDGEPPDKDKTEKKTPPP